MKIDNKIKNVIKKTPINNRIKHYDSIYNATKEMDLSQKTKFLNGTFTPKEIEEFDIGGYSARITRIDYLQQEITKQCKELGITVESRLNKYFANFCFAVLDL